MRRMIRALAALAMIFMILVPLAAGGNSEQNGEDGGLVTINLLYGPSTTEAGPPPADWEVFGIVRDKLGIDLRISALPSSTTDADMKVLAAGAANDLPDLLQINRDPWVNLVRQGLIAPVDDMYEMMPGRTAAMYDEAAIAYTAIDGVSYGLASPGAVSKNEGILIRKDWLDKLGLDVPVTTEDYMEVMRAFTYDDPDGNGKDDTYGFGAFIEITNYEEGLGRRFEPFYGAFGVDGTWDLSADHPGLMLKKPAMYDAMVYIKRMCDEGVIDPNWMSYRKDDFRAAWKQGKFGIIREQNAAFAQKFNYAPFDSNFPDGEWIVIDPPVGPEGYSSVGPNVQDYRIMAVSQKAADEGKKEAIARLLEWMSSEEGYYLLGWGREGVNYVRDENGVPTTAGLPDPDKAFDNPSVVPITQLRNMVFYNSDVELQARYPSYVCDVSGKTMSSYVVLKEMQARPWTNANGANMMPTPNADVKRFYEQGVLEFFTGKRDLNPESWQAFIDEFGRIGGDAWEQEGIAYAEENGILK